MAVRTICDHCWAEDEVASYRLAVEVHIPEPAPYGQWCAVKHIRFDLCAGCKDKLLEKLNIGKTMMATHKSCDVCGACTNVAEFHIIIQKDGEYANDECAGEDGDGKWADLCANCERDFLAAIKAGITRITKEEMNDVD